MQWAAYGDDCYARYDLLDHSKIQSLPGGVVRDETGGTMSIIGQWTLSINKDADRNEKGC